MSGSQRVAGGIFASRIVGLLREVVVAASLGIGPVADAFGAAMRIPNLLQNLLGEGSISAAFVPVYARLVEDDRDDDARALVRQGLGVLGALTAAVVALIVLGARPLVWLTTLGGLDAERFELTVELTRITALGVGFLVLSAFCLGILNAHRRYLLSYAAPVVWSAAQIVVLTVAVVTDVASESIARWGAVAMVIGSVGQLAVQLPTTRSVSGLGRPVMGAGRHLRTVMGRFVPAVAGRGVVQLGSYVDLALASLLAAGAISTMLRVLPLYLLSIAVFGFSVAVAELTEMSRTTSGLDAVARRVRSAQRRVLLPAGLVTAGAVGGGVVVIGTLYEWPNSLLTGGTGATSFASVNTQVAALTLAAFGLGLPATMVARVSQNALYSLGDVRGPARIAAVRLVVAALVGFVMMIQFDHLGAGSIEEAVARARADTRLTDDAGVSSFSSQDMRAAAISGLDVSIADGPFGTTEVGGFPHWPLWEPLPHRGSLVSQLVEPPADGSVPRGTIFVHYGPVGLGFGSAAASWVEWYLLRRRLSVRLGHRPIATGLGRWVAVAGFGAFVVARGVSAIPLPPLVDLVLLGGAVSVAYVGALWFMGLRPRGAAG